MKFYLLALLILIPTLVSAETVVRVGDAIVVDEEQVVDGDYYVSVGPIGNTTMSGVVAGDMYAFGASVTANGHIEKDLVVVGGVSQLHASVTDDVRLLVGEALVAEDIGGDLFVIGGTLNVLSTAKIDGNVYFFGGNAVIDGEVGGSIHGTMERLRIDGPVAGDVDVHTYDTLTLGSKASVQGNVSYASAKDLVRAPESTIEGDISNKPLPVVTNQELTRGTLIPLLIIMFAVLSFYLLFKRQLIALCQLVDHSYTKVTLVGLGVIFLAPVVSILLMATILGLVIGVIGAALTVILLGLGYTLAGVVFGSVLFKYFKKDAEVSLLSIMIGVTGLYAIGLLPVLGPILVLTFMSMVVGGVSLGLYRLVN